MTPQRKAEVFRSFGLTTIPWQVDLHQATERFIVLVCGRRAGKTTAGGREAFLQCMVPESRVWIVAPEMNLAEKEFRIVWSLAVTRGLIPIESKSKRERWIEFRNGSVIECRTEENPDQLIGEGVDLMIVAEAARLRENTWDELLKPTLSDKPGRAIFSSTPRGRNWFYAKFLVGQDPTSAEWRSFHIPSSANPLILRSDIDEIEAAIAADPVTHMIERQEWLAEFVSYAGIVFPEFSLDIHVRHHRYETGHKTMLWVDPGISNPYACLLVQVTGDETIRVLDEIYKTGMTTDEIIKTAESKWPYALLDGGVPGNAPSPELEVVVDEAAAEAIASWRMKGYRAWGAKPPLRTGIDVYHRMLRDPFRSADISATNPLGIWPRITFDPRCAHAIEEHNLYHYPDEARRRSENGPTEVPVDSENHAISAIRYGLFAVFPELFNERHPELEQRIFSPEELGIDLDRMRIDAGYSPREGMTLGDY